MIIGVLKEVLSNENRVSISPDIVVKLTKLGYSVQVEKDAGLKSNFSAKSRFHRALLPVISLNNKLGISQGFLNTTL